MGVGVRRGEAATGRAFLQLGALIPGQRHVGMFTTREGLSVKQVATIRELRPEIEAMLTRRLANGRVESINAKIRLI